MADSGILQTEAAFAFTDSAPKICGYGYRQRLRQLGRAGVSITFFFRRGKGEWKCFRPGGVRGVGGGLHRFRVSSSGKVKRGLGNEDARSRGRGVRNGIWAFIVGTIGVCF